MDLPRLVYRMLLLVLAIVWLINGLFCKLLGLVPRHEEIIAKILGNEYAGTWTILIGIAEIGMAAWILSGWKSRLCAAVQIVAVLTMNVLEFIYTPELLLLGKLNLLFAVLFCSLVYFTMYVLKPVSTRAK